MGKRICGISRQRSPPVFDEGDSPIENRFKRSKLLNFRVSGEEFAQIAEANRASGTRRVSMFARIAVLTPESGSIEVTAVQNHLQQIDRKLDAVLDILLSHDAAEDNRHQIRAFAAAAATM